MAWLGCYILAMVDVLILRKKYPDFSRLFKVPAPTVVFTIGIIGSLYAIHTISDYILITLAWLNALDIMEMELRHTDGCGDWRISCESLIGLAT